MNLTMEAQPEPWAEWGRLLRRWRQHEGLSVTEPATRHGMGAVEYGEWERGKRNPDPPARDLGEEVRRRVDALPAERLCPPRGGLCVGSECAWWVPERVGWHPSELPEPATVDGLGGIPARPQWGHVGYREPEKTGRGVCATNLRGEPYTDPALAGSEEDRG